MLRFCRSLDCDSSGTCRDINTCPVCQNGGTCQDAINGYSCQCILGYTGRHCETNIDECQEVECLVSHLAEWLQKQTSLPLNLFMPFSLIAYSVFSVKVAFLNLNEGWRSKFVSPLIPFSSPRPNNGPFSVLNIEIRMKEQIWFHCYHNLNPCLYFVVVVVFLFVCLFFHCKTSIIPAATLVD